MSGIADQPRRALVVIQALTEGGSERQATIAAMSLQRRGWDCHVAVQREKGIRVRDLEREGIPIHVFPLRSFFRDGLGEAWNLRGFLRREQFHVVHAFDAPSNCLAVPTAWSSGVPLVLASQRAHRSLAGRMWPLLRVCDHLAKGIVVNCAYLADHLVRDEGVAREKIHICYNGLDTAHFHQDGQPARLPFPSGSTVIGTVCALRPEKDLTVLVDAIAQLTATFPTLRLLIVGSGPEEKVLKRRVADHGIGALVHFEPTVADTAPWLRAMDIFVLPSRSEAFSNSLMEAMACGAVPVASKVGGNPELAATGRGELFPVGDATALALALENLIRSPDRRLQLRHAASEWVRTELNLERMTDRLESIYAIAGARA